MQLVDFLPYIMCFCFSLFVSCTWRFCFTHRHSRGELLLHLGIGTRPCTGCIFILLHLQTYACITMECPRGDPEKSCLRPIL